MTTEDTISNLLAYKYCLNIEYYVTLEFNHIRRNQSKCMIIYFVLLNIWHLCKHVSSVIYSWKDSVSQTILVS